MGQSVSIQSAASCNVYPLTSKFLAYGPASLFKALAGYLRKLHQQVSEQAINKVGFGRAWQGRQQTDQRDSACRRR